MQNELGHNPCINYVENNMTIYDTLVQARALITNKRNWTQRANARNKHGRACHPYSPQAKKFCSLGAITNVLVRNKTYGEYGFLVKDFLSKNLAKRFHEINDTLTHEEVLNVWDELIEKAKLEN